MPRPPTPKPIRRLTTRVGHKKNLPPIVAESLIPILRSGDPAVRPEKGKEPGETGDLECVEV